MATSRDLEASPRYRYEDLDLVGEGVYGAGAMDINLVGNVVGMLNPDVSDPYRQRAFVWTDFRGMTELEQVTGRPGGAEAHAINDIGQIVGVSNDRLVVWALGGGIQRTAIEEDSWAHCISRDGKIVGGYTERDLGKQEYAVWDAEFIAVANRLFHPSFPPRTYAAKIEGTSTGAPPVQGWMHPVAVNEPYYTYGVGRLPQLAVGSFNALPEEVEHACVWQIDEHWPVAEDLTPGSSTGSEARAVNHFGVIVGRHGDDAVAWYHGSQHVISNPFGPSQANDINNSGTVVGEASSPDGRPIAVIASDWTREPWIDLNSLVEPDPERMLLRATAINDQGQIVGWSQHTRLGQRAFRLTPPPPFDIPQ